MDPAVETASNDASYIRSDAQDASMLLEALHAAENEGWKALSAPLPKRHRRPALLCRAGVRRSVRLR